MKLLARLVAPALVVLALFSTTATAQSPPEPLPMGVPYVYQYGNPNWYRPVAYGPAPLYGYPSYYPFGASGPVYGRYSWDYNVYFAAGLGYYDQSVTAFPYPIYYPASSYLQYPTDTYNRAWQGFTW